MRGEAAHGWGTRTRGVGGSESGLCVGHPPELLQDPLLRTMIDAFLYWGCKRYLKVWRAEEFFAAHLQKSGAKLGANNNVDRQHAIVAMTYCDLFVTDDKKLAKRCEELRLNLNRDCARVMNGASFIEMLASA